MLENVTRGGWEIAALEEGREFPGQDPKLHVIGAYLAAIAIVVIFWLYAYRN